MSEEPNLSLPALTNEFKRIMDIAAESNGELAPEEWAFIDSIQNELIPKKCDDYAFVINWMQAQEELFDAESKRIKAIAKFYETAQDRMKAKIKAAMGALELDRIEGLTNRFSLSNSSGRLIIEDEKSLPQEYVVMVPKPNNEKIKTDLTAGFPVPGAKLEPGKTLRITSSKKKRLS